MEGRNLSAPSGHLPFQGRLLVRGSIRLEMSLFLDKISVQVTSFAAYAYPTRQGVPAAVYGQPTECHGVEPKATPVVSPREGSDPSDGWGHSWGPGASLSRMEILAGPRAALPTLRPQTDEMLSSNRFQHGGVPPELGMWLRLYKLSAFQTSEYIFHHPTPVGSPPPSAEEGKIKVSRWHGM